MSRTTFLNNARTRLPFAGVAEFYRSLQLGRNGKRNNPFFYVSSSPWNLYDLLKDFLDTTTDPYYRGSFEFGMRKPHYYTGDLDPAVGINQHYWPEMVKHMEQTAPAGADLKSWKY